MQVTEVGFVQSKSFMSLYAVLPVNFLHLFDLHTCIDYILCLAVTEPQYLKTDCFCWDGKNIFVSYVVSIFVSNVGSSTLQPE